MDFGQSLLCHFLLALVFNKEEWATSECSEGLGVYCESRFNDCVDSDVPIPYLRVSFLPNQGHDLGTENLLEVRILLSLEVCYSNNSVLGLMLSFFYSLATGDESLNAVGMVY